MDFKQKTWEIEIGDRDTYIPFDTYTVEIPSLNAVKREIPKLAKDHPALMDALNHHKIRWDIPSNYRDTNIPVGDRTVKGNIPGFYIYITLSDEVEPPVKVSFETKVIRAAMAVMAMGIAVLMVYSIRYSMDADYLRKAMMSTYPDYGKRVLAICNKYGTVKDYQKLGWIVEDFNKEILKLERTYTLPKDYDNMIRTLTQNWYTLEYSYLYETPQHPLYELHRQTREKVSRKSPRPYKEEGLWFEFLQQRREQQRGEGETQ